MFHPTTINQSALPVHEVQIDINGQVPVTPVAGYQEFSSENPYAHLPNKKLHIALPAMPLQNLPVSPPQTPDFLPTNADSMPKSASANYGQSMMAQQQMQYIDSLAEAGRKLADLEVEQEKGRILFGGEGVVDLSSESSSSTPSASPPPTYTQTVAQQAQLLPSHMQKTTNNRFTPVRQNSHTVSFADESPKDRSRSPSPPGTPKGHPITQGFRLDKYLNYQRRMRQVEQGREKLLGFIGGAGAVTGMKLTRNDRLFGKISRPVQHSHTSAINPPATLYTFRATVSYLTRIPRKSKNLLAMLLCFCLLASMIFRMSVAHAEKERQFLSKRYALGLQKAFVIAEDASNYARHPSYHLNPDAVDQVRDSETMSALAAEDIAEAAQDVTFLSAPVPTSDFVFKFANEREELAALVSFLTSTSSNALPAVDPALPLDPQLVLDFDYTKAETARDDMELLTEDVFNLFPTIIVGKMRDPNHRDVLKAFSGYTLSPPPLVIEVDQRRDAQILTPLLARLLDREDLPAVILNGKAFAGHKEVMDLQEKGEIKKALSGEGIAIKDKLVKKKKHRLVKDAERKEQERILGPQPILEDGKSVGEEVKWW